MSRWMSVFSWNFTAAILLAVCACLPRTALAAVELQMVWDAPLGTGQNQAATHWLQTQWIRLSNPPAGCARKYDLPALSPLKQARAYSVKLGEKRDAANEVLYLQEPIAEYFILIGEDARGCPWASVSGRGVDFAERDLVSPFPNTRLPDLGEHRVVHAVIQDYKTIRPWVLLASEPSFQRETILIWIGLAAYSGILLVMIIIALGFDVWVRSRMALSYTVFVIGLQLWIVQNFGVGDAVFSFWPGPAFFPVFQALSVAGVVIGIGYAVVEFLRVGKLARRLILAGVFLSAAAFFSSAWHPLGYRAGSAVLASLALMTIVLLVRAVPRGDLSVRLFALGLGATMLGGGVQAYSVISGGADVSRLAVFAFPLGTFVQSVFWLAALSVRVRVERRALREQLIHDATHDAVTGLPNRPAMMRRVAACVADAKDGGGQSFGLLFIDLDRFKVVNDSLGHTFGDLLLKKVADILVMAAGPGCTVARFGGDEFLVLFEKSSFPAEVSRLAAALVTALNSPIAMGEREIHVGASIGVVMIGPDSDSAESVIRDADTALQEAKKSGRGQYLFFEESFRTKAEKRFRLENDLSVAIKLEQFELFYQPIIDLGTSRHAGFEALVRWQHPGRGFVSPADFVPVAEDTGLIRELGSFILRRAVETVGRWKREGLWLDGWYVSINVSGGQLQDDSLLGEIEGLLVTHGVACGDIRIELTETAVISNIEVADRLLPRFREMGIVLCMDDFGTGYSSLSYLADLPFGVLKIDKSFIDDIVSRSDQRALVKAVLTLAREMGLLVVAEGIEFEAQSQMLRAMKCGYGQGYLFAKPLAPADATRWLQSAREARQG